MPADIPVGSRKKLLCYIDEVSFAVYEALLYLDTHPNDPEALHYFHEHNRKRNFALKEYAKSYGPLNIGAMDDDASRSWEWACQPWPWEGGND
ncbi:MAG: spore coat protein CotJB [Lachnospiraceae bacterium]|nr:spore coat protein CotJB [Lachnospiraceae bacterium]